MRLSFLSKKDKKKSSTRALLWPKSRMGEVGKFYSDEQRFFFVQQKTE